MSEGVESRWCGRNLFFATLPGGWWKNFESWSIETLHLRNSFLFFPFPLRRGPGWERRGKMTPPLITPGPARGSVVTRSIFISKSFPLSTAVSSKLGWGAMGSIEWLREIEFGELSLEPTDFTDSIVSSRTRRVDRIELNPMIEKSSIFAIASPRYSQCRRFLIEDVSMTYLSSFLCKVRCNC